MKFAQTVKASMLITVLSVITWIMIYGTLIA